MKTSFLLLFCFFLVHGFFLNAQTTDFEESGAGVTIMVHGWDPDGNQPAWMDAMANAIIQKTGGEGQIGTMTVSGSLDVTYDPWNFDLSNQNSGEMVVLINWTEAANHLTTEIAAEEVAAAVVPGIYEGQNGQPPLAGLPIHLIGHSRGGGMVYEIARLLGEQGIDVDQVTALDPHPLTANDPQPIFGNATIDTPVKIYENVLFADNYWQNIEFPMGSSVNGAYNRLWTSLEGGYHNETGYTYKIGTDTYNFSDHLNIILAYHGTIDTATPVSNGEATMTQSERDNWYNTYENEGANTGFHFSRIITGNRKSTDAPVADGDQIIDGYHNNAILGGNGEREVLEWTDAAWPNVLTSYLSDADGDFQPGLLDISDGDVLNINFTYRLHASDAVATFHIDTDRNPYNNNNAATIGNMNLSQTGSTITTATKEWTVSDLNKDTDYYLYIKIQNDEGTRYFYPSYQFSVIDDGTPTRIVDKKENQLSVFPNPATDIITINTGNIDPRDVKNITLTDINGKVVREKKDITTPSPQINLSGLKPGLFILSLSTETGNLSKIILKK